MNPKEYLLVTRKGWFEHAITPTPISREVWTEHINGKTPDQAVILWLDMQCRATASTASELFFMAFDRPFSDILAEMGKRALWTAAPVISAARHDAGIQLRHIHLDLSEGSPIWECLRKHWTDLQTYKRCGYKAPAQ